MLCRSRGEEGQERWLVEVDAKVSARPEWRD